MPESATAVSSSAARSRQPLAEIERLAGVLGADDVAQGARELAARLAEGRFYVACIGQFKRGKSTLLNALVGDSILPTGVVPVTSVVTVLRYGERRGARVLSSTGGWTACDPSAVGEFVSEDQNPGNRKAVRAVELFVPCPLLATGLCLVDTPGVGSVIEENTAAAHAFVPHVDAALVVLGADPPISAPEIRLIAEIAPRVEDLIFVLNKADRVSESERREAVAFSERMLRERLGKPIAPTLQVSATERLAGEGQVRQWPELVASLERLAQRSGADLVRAAEERGVQSLRKLLAREIAERRGALVRPLAESRERVERLRRARETAERALADLGALLSVEQVRISRRLGEELQAFFANAAPAASEELVAELRAGRAFPADLRHRSMELAVEVARRSIDRWRAEQQPRAEELYRGVAKRFTQMAAEAQAMIVSDHGLEDVPVVGEEAGLPVRSRYYFTEMLGATPKSLGRRLADRLGTSKGRARSIEAAAVEYLARLLEVNGARIRNDFEERILESRRRLEAEIRRRLEGASSTAERSLQAAMAAQSTGTAAMSNALASLDVTEAALAELDRG